MRSRIRAAAVAAAAIVLSAAAASAASLTVVSNFLGPTLSESGFIPPDTMGAVGDDLSNQLVVMINGRFRVVNKTTGATVQDRSLHAFFTTNAGLATNSSFDPRILWSQAERRWYAVAVDNARSASSRVLIARSNTADASGSWSGFGLDADSTDARWADFPMLGQDSTGVYVSANMFGVSTGTAARKSIFAVDKANFSAAGTTRFDAIDPNSTGFSLQPVVNLDGTGLGAGAPVRMLSGFNLSSGFLKTSTLTGTAAAPTLNTTGGFISVTSRNNPPDAVQPGTPTAIDTNDTRFSGNVVMVDGKIWAVHSADIGGRSGAVWYRIDAATNTVEQTGVLTDPALAFYFPSIAVNGNGDVVISVSGSGASTFASGYAFLGTTTGGVTTFSAPLLLRAGVASYVRLDSNNRNRWGDYAATVVDPSHPDVFWAFTEFANATDSWQIAMTSLRVTPIPEPTWLLPLAAAPVIGFGGPPAADRGARVNGGCGSEQAPSPLRRQGSGRRLFRANLIPPARPGRWPR